VPRGTEPLAAPSSAQSAVTLPLSHELLGVDRRPRRVLVALEDDGGQRTGVGSHGSPGKQLCPLGIGAAVAGAGRARRVLAAGTHADRRVEVRVRRAHHRRHRPAP
jgi:hypothetical protein